MKALFDTCILIDYLNGRSDARDELARYDDKAISLITWMEVMVGATTENEAMTRRWLDTAFRLIDVTHEISEHAVMTRKVHRIRLPDAIIYATAVTTNRLLVTRNTKDFDVKDPVVRIPYPGISNSGDS